MFGQNRNGRLGLWPVSLAVGTLLLLQSCAGRKSEEPSKSEANMKRGAGRLGDDESASSRVRAYCMTVVPSPEYLYSLPSMDERTLLAAAQLARRDNPQFYGDLAAAIVREYREHALHYSMTPLFGRSDVHRFFEARFAKDWGCSLGDEPLLALVYEWIVENRGRLFASDLLEEEIRLTVAVKDKLYQPRRPSDTDIKEEHYQRVRAFCETAEPVAVGGAYAFPPMDDEALLSAEWLARSMDNRLYGDLAAVAVRVHRAQMSRYGRTIALPVNEDIPRLLRGRFWQLLRWRVEQPGEDATLADLYDVIAELATKSPDRVPSRLLQKELGIEGGDLNGGSE